MRRLVLAFVSSLSLAATLVATASQAGAAGPAPVDSLLRSIDVVPASRAELERSLPDAQAQLIAAAKDATRDTYTRLRAIAFVSFYPDATTRAALVELAKAPAPDIRRAAVYSLGRTFGAIAGDPVARGIADLVADVAERDADAAVREHAVRALRWVDDPAAAARLERIGKARPELAELVKTTLERRAKRVR